MAEPTAHTVVHLKASEIAGVIDRLGRRSIERSIVPGLEERHEQTIRRNGRHRAILLPGAAALGGEFTGIIAIIVVAEQEVTQRSPRRHILARQSTVQDQNTIRIQEDRVKAQAVSVSRVRVYTRSTGYVHIFGGESLIFAIPQPVVDNSIGLGIPKAAAQPRAG